MQYGSGHFRNQCISIRVVNPFAPYYKKWLEGEFLSIQQAHKSGEYTELGIFPEPGGLMPWGNDDNGCQFCWATDGEPSSWTVVVLLHGHGFERWKLSLTTFLTKAFTKKIKVEAWPDPIMSSKMRFIPQ